MIVLDCSAWVEYLKGSDLGEIVKKYIAENDIVTPSIVLIELSCKAEKEKWNFQEQLKFIKSKSTIIGLTERMILQCGKNYIEQRKKKPKFGIADAIILTTAKEINAKILTKDNDFQGLNEVILLE